jgi:hypothetical protein
MGEIMSNPDILYPSDSVVSTSPTAPVENVVDVLNLRQEALDLITGTRGETPIGQYFLLRKVRRDSSDIPTKCVCVGEDSGSPSSDWGCTFCNGIGYLWDEQLIRGYNVVVASSANSDASINIQKTEAGYVRAPSIKFFFPYDSNIKVEDIIVEIELGVNGTPVTPYNRIQFHEITLARQMRADNGKIEFFTVNTQSISIPTAGRNK